MATVLLIAFFSVDAILTGYALKVFYYRACVENNLEITNKNQVQNKYAKIQENESFAGFINQYYDNEKILKNYPNMMIEQKNKSSVYVESFVEDVKPYYYRLGEAF